MQHHVIEIDVEWHMIVLQEHDHGAACVLHCLHRVMIQKYATQVYQWWYTIVQYCRLYMHCLKHVYDGMTVLIRNRVHAQGL